MMPTRLTKKHQHWNNFYALGSFFPFYSYLLLFFIHSTLRNKSLKWNDIPLLLNFPFQLVCSIKLRKFFHRERRRRKWRKTKLSKTNIHYWYYWMKIEISKPRGMYNYNLWELLCSCGMDSYSLRKQIQTPLKETKICDFCVVSKF